MNKAVFEGGISGGGLAAWGGEGRATTEAPDGTAWLLPPLEGRGGGSVPARPIKNLSWLAL